MKIKSSQKRKTSEWGIIQSKQVPGYIFDKHFYCLLIKNEGNLININNGRSILLNDVKVIQIDRLICIVENDQI